MPYIKIFKNKRDYLNRKYFNSSGDAYSELEKMKFYIASYNAGQGTILKAIKLTGIENPQWNDLLNPTNHSQSALWNAIPESWGRAAKYEEITTYVEQTMNRRYQQNIFR